MNWTIIITIFLIPAIATFLAAMYARKHWGDSDEKLLREHRRKMK